MNSLRELKALDAAVGTYDNSLIFELKEGIENIRDVYRRAFIGELFNEVKKEYEDGLISFVVFGSVARGTDLPSSDLDLLLILDTDVSFFERTYRLSKLLNKVKTSNVGKALESKGYSLSIEVYPLTVKEADGFRMIYLDISFDAVIIYDKGSFFKKLMLKVRDALNRLGSMRLNLPNGSWIWILKPNLRFGEEFYVDI